MFSSKNTHPSHRILFKSFITFSLSLFTASALAAGKDSYGGHYFKSLRDDQTIPEKCREVNLSHFTTHDLDEFYYGPVGANNRGFTHEYPIRRDDAKKLWNMARGLVNGADRRDVEQRLKNDQRMLRDFRIVADHYEEMDFDFASEGEILEILAIVDMQDQVPEGYYVYGSVFYHDKVAGELDLMVGRKSDCQIIALGEAKLGLKSLSKARRQLDRFKNFLRTHLHNYLNPFALEQYAR